MAAAPVKPLVAIVGATGTGKSDLAVEIARKYNGEVINGDAMQLYEGLPIITNKITKDEMKGVPHHLLGCIGLDEETWTVGKFVSKALGVINEIRSRGKLPVLVGGTHYYTQSLLFQDALSEELQLENEKGQQTGRFPILDEPTAVILEKLKEVDTVMADRWHPNERRKIQRSLEIYLKTGKPASQIYDEQRLKREVSLAAPECETSDVGLRFPTLLLWVHASKDLLYTRLDGRIDKMIQKGLLSEVQRLSDFAASYEKRTGAPVDLTRGIWVSIGYKEFLDYHAALSNPSLSESDLAKMRTAAIEKTQAATRQYAKRQIRWIQIKLLNASLAAGQRSNIFLLDGSDLSKWEGDVIRPAIQVTEQFLSGKPLPNPTQLSGAAQEMLTPKRDFDLAQRPDLWQKKVCDTCGTVAVTENDWYLHIKSRAHRRAVGNKKKQEHSESSATKKGKGTAEDSIDLFESSLNNFSEKV
ncbi:tRNA isopentenyltransferase [Lentithecium fluviatile CBS 122367]|uniref:tRNA dimethylallyltransferase n=1 Tax=Lentithecium fluviatile CBS 122367 TaxID=1168545 RepID=A0A6G1JGL2_9PLEO|nr:tRNA isopentenyltransferase [Lentithecium fluviatile CBS 122367]